MTPKTPLILFLGLLVTGTTAKTLDLTFPLNNADELCININNLLSGDQMLNDLSVTQVGDFSFEKPNAFEQKEVKGFLPEDIQPDSLTALTTFGKRMAGLARSTDGQNVGVIIKFDPKTEEKTVTTHQIAPKDARCLEIAMDQDFLSTACYSALERQGYFCNVRHTPSGFTYDCSNAFNFNLPEDQRIEEGELQMDSFTGREKNRLFAFYYTAGKSAYDRVKHMFYLRDNVHQKFIELEAGVRILSISITSYDFDRKLANLLIHVEDKDRKPSLRYYTVQDFIIKCHDGKEYDRFDLNPTAVYFRDFSLFIAEEATEAGLPIRKVNLKERKFPKMVLKGQSKVARIVGSRNIFLFETLDAQGARSWFLLDTFCDRFFKFDDLLPDLGRLKWTVVQIGYASYIVVFRGHDVVLFKVNSFQSVCATFPQKQFVSGELNFAVGGQPVLTAHFRNHPFEAVLDKEVISPHTALSTDTDVERQFHLAVRGNDLDFAEGSPVYYFHRVQLASADSRPEDACVPLKVLIKNRRMVSLCEGNRLMVYSDYSMDFDTKTFEFRFKSTYTFADLDLSKIKEVKLYYGQYLALIDDQRRFTYIDLDSDAASLPIVHSDELKQYEACVFSKHNIICLKDTVFAVLEVSKNNEQLIFLITNAMQLPNARLDSVVLSQYHQNTVYYLRQSFSNAKGFYLIQEIDHVDRKMSRNRLPLSGEHTKVVELNKDEFVLIEWSDGLRIRGLMGDSFLEYPFKHAALFETVLAIRMVEDAKLFLIFYKTLEGRARVYIGRSSLMAYDRTVRDVEVGEYLEGMQIEAHFIVWSQVLIHVYRRGDKNVSHSFVYFLNGPIFFLAPHSPLTSIHFRVNGKEVTQAFAPSEPLTPLHIEHKTVNFRDPEGRQVVHDVEEEGLLKITGGIKDIDADADTEDVKLIPRIFRADSKHIRSSVRRGLDAHGPKNLASSFNDFSFFYGDFIYKKKEQKSNRLFRNCKFIDNGDLGSAANPKLLCRDKAINDNVITDLVDDPMYLKAPSFKFNAHNLIETPEYRFFFAKSNGNKNLHFWRFKRGESGFELESRRVVTANDYFLGSMNVEAFYATARLIPNKIVLLIHEAFAPKITIKILGIKTNVFEKYHFEEVPLLVDGGTEPQAIYDMKCSDNIADASATEPLVRCLIRSDQYIYDTVVTHQEGQGVSFRVHTKFPFWKNELNGGKMVVAASHNFIAVLTKATSGNDVFVYRRPVPNTLATKAVTSDLYGSFRVNSRDKMLKISISDPDKTALDNNKQIKPTDATLWIATFSEPIHDSKDVYKHLYVNQYLLSTFKVQANPKADRVHNEIELRATDQSNTMQTVHLRVVIEQNFLVRVLLWVFIFLLIALVGLLVFVFRTYKQNKQLKESMLREGHNQSMFLDRTMMQI